MRGILNSVLKNKKSSGKHEKGINLTELMIVIIIIIIVIGLTLPNLTRPKQEAWDKEAQMALKLIQAAEKIYFMKHSFHYPPTASASNPVNSLTAINSALRISLSAGSGDWDFTIKTPSGSNFVASATSRKSGKVYQIDRNAGPY